eukprot:TRINITY_DN2644_c0_g1_i2.p1 TRINITY_DN2644_c0_g1~~TRINITY_DN2644_c0_g1_i2.p1  ORF type:complete len:163 (-),score=78.84 TRINITY_DN2644_c0_g1_i2:90-518(-)
MCIRDRLLLVIVSFAILAFVSAERRPARKVSLAELRIADLWNLDKKVEGQEKKVDDFLNKFKKKDPILGAIIEEFQQGHEMKQVRKTLKDAPEKVREAKGEVVKAAHEHAKEQIKKELTKTVAGFLNKNKNKTTTTNNNNSQ